MHKHKYRAHKADVEDEEPTWLEWREECVAEGLERDWCYEEAIVGEEEEVEYAKLTPQEKVDAEACTLEGVAKEWSAWYCKGPKAVELVPTPDPAPPQP